MALEAETETSDAGDIRSALAAAITEHEAPAVEMPAPKASAKEAPELPLETEDKPKAETKGRDESGKFARKTEAKPEGETEKPEVKADKAEPEGGKEKPEADDKNPLSPDFQKTLAAWKPADQAMFKALVPEAQQFVMRRYKEMTADYTKKLQDVSRLKTDYEPVDKLFEPHRDVMKQRGLTPASLVEAWGNVEKKLASGDEGAVEIIKGLQRGYNIPVAKIAAALGITAAQSQATHQQTESEQQRQQAQVQLPPEVMQALQLIPQLQQTVTGLTAAQQRAQEDARTAAGDKAMQEIEQFKSAVDDKGTLLRPHFEAVEQDMVDLANALMKDGKPVPPLAELYERAVWSNSSTRDLMLAAREQAEQKKRLDQDKSKAAAARKAAVSVTGAPGTGQAQAVRHAPERSLRDEIESNLAEQSAA